MPNKRPPRKTAREHQSTVHSILVGVHTLAVSDPYLLAACLDWIRAVIDEDRQALARVMLLSAASDGTHRRAPYRAEDLDAIYQDAANLLARVVEDNADAILRAVVTS